MGSAVNEAYKLESQKAIYPRIVISDKIINDGPDSYFRKDSDDFRYFDVMKYCMEEKGYQITSDMKMDYITFIERFLKEGKDSKIAQKYEWLSEYI